MMIAPASERIKLSDFVHQFARSGESSRAFFRELIQVQVRGEQSRAEFTVHKEREDARAGINFAHRARRVIQFGLSMPPNPLTLSLLLSLVGEL